MEKITSFTIDHNKLQPGVYVSRKDQVEGGMVTTFDLRMTSPNEEPVMNTAEMHTIEHLGATFLRNHGTFGKKCIYFGPMGCRTGFYLLLAGDYQSADILPLMVEMYVYQGFSGGGARGVAKGLRQLSGYEFGHGQIPGREVPGSTVPCGPVPGIQAGISGVGSCLKTTQEHTGNPFPDHVPERSHKE